jgi:adenine phosphoribosyltransferase
MTLDEIATLIKDVPDFPKPGIVFKDITPLLASPAAVGATVKLLADRVRELEPEVILAIESRGFIFGAMLAHEIGLPLQLVRKRGKLPRESVSVRYELEYGVDHLEVHVDAIEPGERCLIVDDLMATGGTAAAVARLVAAQHGIVAGCVFLIELDFLRGRDKLADVPIVSLLRY